MTDLFWRPRPMKPFASLRLLLCVATLVPLFSSCTETIRLTKTVHDSPDRYVLLNARYGEDVSWAVKPFAHPLVMEEQDWARLLAGLSVKPRRGLLSIGMAPDAREAFDKEERQYLARYLAEGFATARPDQWVEFFLSRRRDHDLVEITSGAFFATSDRIHLVLANYRHALSMPFIQEQIRHDPVRPAGESFYEVVPGSYHSVQAVAGNMNRPLFSHLSDVDIQYRAVLSSSNRPRAEQDEFNAQSGSSESQSDQIRERLKRLQKLWEQGLITKEEYQAQRQRILNSL
ncbi:MAG: SHOCT domain-containing protein [Nitrospirae bacterium]|nr:SHOCT domain-containing protein [Nitrospirota bacterium]